MNKNIDLTVILRDCPKGTKLYSPIFGEGELLRINNDDDSFPIVVISKGGIPNCFDATGKTYYSYDETECLLFPSKDQRDWSKFKTKKPKFDPKTLKPFDKVLLKNENNKWNCAFVSHIESERIYLTTGGYICGFVLYCIPYNEDTKHLIGTSDEAPEYYRYWEE